MWKASVIVANGICTVIFTLNRDIYIYIYINTSTKQIQANDDIYYNVLIIK